MPLSLHLLGPFRATLDDRDITAHAPDKGWALLTYLALEADRAHRREALAEMLWPERPSGVALGNLRSLLVRLRRAIAAHEADPPYLLITRETIRFSPDSDHHLDVAELAAAQRAPVDLQRLTRAVATCRGRFGEGLSVGESAAFQEWLLLEQQEVERQYLGALSLLAEQSEAAGDHAAAERYARRQLELEPWREEAHRQLMRALVLGGQRSAALAQYEACRQVLAQELGAEPAAETVALGESIRRGTLGGQPVTAAAIAEPAEVAEARPSFVGRERELGVLGRHLDEAVAGQGRVVFVIGDPGSGKTMLLHELSRRALAAHEGLVVAGGSGNAYTGTGDPYLPFMDVLRMLTGDVQARHSRGAVSREQARRLRALVPEAARAVAEVGPDLMDVFVAGAALLARVRSASPAAGVLEALQRLAAHRGANPPQPQLLEQYTEVVCALARRRPLLLTVDDLQWADRGSIELLFHLGRRLAGSPVLLVGAYRPGEVALGREGERHPLEPVANELRGLYGTAPVDLDRAEGREFVEALLEREPNRLTSRFRDDLYHHTGGHPLFTVELLADMRDRGGLVRDEEGLWREGPELDWEGLPGRLEAVIGERVGRLSGESRRLLEVASLEGEEFTAEVVAQVLGVSPVDVVGQLSRELARRHQLVQAQSLERLDGHRLSRYRFRHYLFQRYLYQSLDAVERAHLHEAVGRAQEAVWGETAGEMALQLAWHYEEAGLGLKAAQCYLRAADRAQWMAAMVEAEGHYRRGLALMEGLPAEHRDLQTEMRLQTGLCVAAGLTRSAASPELTPLYERALELCRRADDSPLVLQVLGELEYHYEARAEYDRALAVLSNGFGPLLAEGDAYALVWTHKLLGRILRRLGSFALARVHLERGADWVADHLDDFMTLAWFPNCLGHLARVLFALGYADQGLRRAGESDEAAERFGHAAIVAIALGRVAAYRHDVYRDAGSLAECMATVEAFERETGGGWKDAAAMAAAHRGYVLLHTGRPAEGARHIRAAVAALVRDGFLCYVPETIHWLAEAYLRAGQADAGLKAAAAGLRLAYATGERCAESPLHLVMGDLLRRRGGEHDERLAEARYRSAIEVARRQEAKLFELRAATALARLRRDQGKRDEARDLLAGVYGWFTEGFDAYDLKQARVLLAELGHPVA